MTTLRPPLSLFLSSLLLSTVVFSIGVACAEQNPTNTSTINSETNKIKTRVFQIVVRQHPSVKGPEPRGDEARKYLEAQGVEFPEGTSALFDEESHLLVVTHTEQGLEAVRKVLERDNALPSQVTIEVRFLQLHRPLAEDLFADDEGLSKACIVREKVLKRIIQLERQGKIIVVCQPKLVTVSGNTAQVKAVREMRYPTEYHPPPPGTTNSTSRATQTTATAVTPYTPAGFETREVGSLFNVTPTIGPDGTTINLTLVPEVSTKSPKSLRYESVPPQSQFAVEQPVFFSYQTTTTVMLRSGSTMLLAVMDPVPEDGKLTQDNVVLLLLSASVIRE